MRGTWVGFLVREDSMCRGATKPTNHNDRSPQSAHPRACACNKRSHHDEKGEHHNESSPRPPQVDKDHGKQRRPSAAKNVCVQSCPTLCGPVDCSCQAPLSMRFSRQEFWSGWPFPPPGHLPDPGIEHLSPASPALAGRFFTTSTT